MVKHSHNNWTT